MAHVTVRLQPTVRLQLSRLIRAKYSSYAPITFEDIVIVMIIQNISFEDYDFNVHLIPLSFI